MPKDNNGRIMANENAQEQFFLEHLAKSIASSQEFDRVVRALVPHLVHRWAGRNVFKKAIARPVAKSIQKGFSENNKSVIADELCAAPDLAKAALKEVPALANKILEFIMRMVKSFSDLPDEEKADVVVSFVGSLEVSRAAEVINDLVKITGDIHRTNPHFFADTLAPVIASLIETADFGELKEAIENSADDAELLARKINEKLWEYPAKVICLLSLIPTFANILVCATTETLAPINRLAPDLLTDVVFSLVNDVEGARIGTLVNELSELVRKLHTGSALLGEPGKPQLPRVVQKIAEDILSTIDSASVLKAMGMLEEMRSMAQMSFADAAEKHPDLVKGMYRQKFQSLNSRLRYLARKLDFLEMNMDDDESARFLSQGIAELDPQEVASIINRACTLFNRARKSNSAVVRDALSQMTASLDYEEMGRALRGFIEDAVDALRPVASEIMPPLVRGFAELLSEDDGSDEMRDALEAFRNAILGKEVAR